MEIKHKIKKNGLEQMQEIIDECQNRPIFMGELKVEDESATTLYTPRGYKRHIYLVYEGPADESGRFIMVNGVPVEKGTLVICLADVEKAAPDNLETVLKCWHFIHPNGDSLDKDIEKAEIMSDEERRELMFEEIERIDELMHTAVKINNSDLSKLFHDHMCVCGSLIFSTFLPDDIRKEYGKWQREQKES